MNSRNEATVGRVVEVAKAWVERHASQTPGYVGAHLLGSINTMAADSLFPGYLDVDLVVVVDTQDASPNVDLPYSGLLQDNRELSYEGFIFEIVFFSRAVYLSAEAVLSNPALAHSLAFGHILADPEGWLADLQREVAAGYRLRRWARARCEDQKMLVRGTLLRLDPRASPPELAFGLAWLGKFFGTLVALAHLEPPTHRRSLALMGSLLEKQEAAELHERTLDLLGYGKLSRQRVEVFLGEMKKAFERAVEVRRNPSPYGWKIERHVLPYFVEGSREMIEQGRHREAMFWIFGAWFTAIASLSVNLPAEERTAWEAPFGAALAEMELLSPEGHKGRIEAANTLAEELFQVVDRQLVESPDLAGA